MKRIPSLLLSAVVAVQITMCTGCSPGSQAQLQILGKENRELITLGSISDERQELNGNNYRAYLETVLSEAEEIIADLRSCDQNSARKFLLKNECVIYTSFDQTVFDSISKAYESRSTLGFSFGCAVTDLHGQLLALYSAGATDDPYINYAVKKTPPYSSFKPLCVYAPAIESGLVCWSTVFLDSPIKKIQGANGRENDWPLNATGTYTNENISIAYAIKTSLNTVAARCMQLLGVDNSMAFLERNFGLVLDYEKEKAKALGEDEVFGNVALGYLYEGVSPLDMAGYYQAFANGGSYCQPHTIQKICDQSGSVLYEDHTEEKQVLKSTTAFIMNQLLQGVVTAKGTGEKAYCEGVSIGGKTGTGDRGNWFVGFTPQYTCAVWHGTELEKNTCCELFSEVVSGFENKSDVNFPDCSGIQKAIYCSESGMLFSDKCKKADIGYYCSDFVPEVCNVHQ